MLSNWKTAIAVTTPTFATCIAPEGTVRANHNSGTHGIPGDTNTYFGKDTVYTISENSIIQCFCSSNGKGIQTNWLKAKQYSDDDLKILKSQGWIYISNGQIWGLENEAYVAKNEEFSCLGNRSQVGGSNYDSKRFNPNILGLASTGSTSLLTFSFIVGILLLISSINLRKK